MKYTYIAVFQNGRTLGNLEVHTEHPVDSYPRWKEILKLIDSKNPELEQGSIMLNLILLSGPNQDNNEEPKFPEHMRYVPGLRNSDGSYVVNGKIATYSDVKPEDLELIAKHMRYLERLNKDEATQRGKLLSELTAKGMKIPTQEDLDRI